jgi:hypothetical protein
MESEGWLSRSQQPATGHYTEPYEYSPHLPIYFPKIRSNIILTSTSRISGQYFACIYVPCVPHSSPISLSLSWYA